MSFSSDAAYYFLDAPIVAPLEILSNQPAYTSETVSLKRSVVAQQAQRWELSFRLTPGCHQQYLSHSVANRYTEFTMKMPQVYCRGAQYPLTNSISSDHSLGQEEISIPRSSIDRLGWSFSFDSHSTVYTVTSRTGNNAFSPGFSTGFLNANTYTNDVYTITPALTQPVSVSDSLTWLLDATIDTGVAAGASSVSITGATSTDMVGRFVKFSNHDKVYMVTAATYSPSTTLTLFPNLLEAVSTSDTCRTTDIDIKVRYDTESTLSGIRYIDGVLADPGHVSLIESL